MKKINRALSILVAFLMLLGMIPMSTMIVSAASSETDAIEALKTAWQNLESEEKSEIWAIPQNTRTTYTTGDVTDETAAAMGFDKEKLGSRYAEFSSGVEVFYTANGADMNTRLKNLSSYNRIELCTQQINSDGNATENNTTTATFYCKSHDWTTGYEGYIKVGTGSFSSQSAHSLNNLFNNASYKPAYFSIKEEKGVTGSTGDKFRAGCIIAYYNEKIALPENTDSWAADDWFEAAVALDTEGYNNVDAFELAVANLRKYAENEKIEALKTAWQNLEGEEKSEIWAIPQNTRTTYTTGDVTDETAAAMGFDKEKLGSRYAEFSSGVEVFYTANGADMNTRLKNLSSYNRIELCTQQINSDGNATENDTTTATFYCKSHDWTTGYEGWIKVGTGSFSGQSAHSLNNLFNNASYKPAYFSIKEEKGVTGSTGDKFRAGCIIAYYNEKIALPENTDDWCADNWVEAAKELDISSLGNTEDFEAAITELSAFAEAYRLEALKDAWQSLSVERSEAIAAPDIAQPFTKATTEEIAAEMGTTIDKVGPYYAEFTVSGGNGGFNYKTLDGQLGLGSLSAYDRVEFFIDRTDAEGDSSLVFSPRNTSYGEIAQVIVHPGLNSFDEASALGTVLTDVDISVYFINLACYANGSSFRVGSIIGYYTEGLKLPEGSESWSYDDWLIAAGDLDMTKYDNAEKFANILNVIKADAFDSGKIYDIKSAWVGLGLELPELTNEKLLNEWIAVTEDELSDNQLAVNLIDMIEEFKLDKSSGDANCDGSTDIRDLIRAKKFVAGASDKIYVYATDMSGDDGIINAIDLSELKIKLLDK